MASSPLFTAIVHTYYRPALLRKAVAALREQTYSNIEIILINDGATPKTVEFLTEVAAADPRIKIVNFAENQFRWDDPHYLIHVCYNAALAEATGDYVWIQDDDDILADDYAEKMVALFQDNPECTTAAGLPVSMNADGEVNPVAFGERNIRPIYTPGHELALDQISGSRKMFGAPGNIFTIKRDVLVEAGGYHKAIESSHLYGIVPFGVSGFDPTALFYWRHHDGQLNKQLTSSGFIGTNYALELLNDWKLEERWNVFGADVARRFVHSYKRNIYRTAARWFVINLFNFRLRPSIRAVGNVWLVPQFWAQVFAQFLNRRYWVQTVAPVVKPALKRLFRRWPALARFNSSLGKLSKKAEHWD